MTPSSPKELKAFLKQRKEILDRKAAFEKEKEKGKAFAQRVKIALRRAKIPAAKTFQGGLIGSPLDVERYGYIFDHNNMGKYGGEIGISFYRNTPQQDKEKWFSMAKKALKLEGIPFTSTKADGEYSIYIHYD